MKNLIVRAADARSDSPAKEIENEHCYIMYERRRLSALVYPGKDLRVEQGSIQSRYR